MSSNEMVTEEFVEQYYEALEAKTHDPSPKNIKNLDHLRDRLSKILQIRMMTKKQN